jgi:hypothetical protein
MQTISDLLEQLVASLLASSTLLQDDNNLFQTCQQLGQAVGTHLVDKLRDFYVIIYYLNIFIHGSLSVACFSKGRGLKLLKRYKSKPKV